MAPGITGVVVMGLAALAGVPGSALARPVPGDLDPSFGHRGKVLTKLADTATSVDIGHRGRIVVAGGSPFAVARYKSDGHLDRSFSENGRVKTRFGSKSSIAYSVAISGHGKIVAAGGAPRNGSHHSKLTRVVVARYKPNGHLDHSFSRNGMWKKTFGSSDRYHASSDVAVDSKGRILIAIRTLDRDGYARGFIVRLTADGHLDSSFGHGGRVSSGLVGFADSVTVDRRGRVVALSDAYLVRYEPHGNLDRTFGANGRARLSLGKALVIDSSGRMVVAGVVLRPLRFMLARFTPDGDPDASFGTGGQVVTVHGIARSVAVDSRGRIVAFGDGHRGTRHVFALVRRMPNGAPDRSFGHRGEVQTDLGTGTRAYGAAVDRHDRIVGVGGASDRFALARWIGYR